MVWYSTDKTSSRILRDTTQCSNSVHFFGEKQHIEGTVKHLRFRNTGFFRHLPYFLLCLLVNGCLHTFHQRPRTGWSPQAYGLRLAVHTRLLVLDRGLHAHFARSPPRSAHHPPRRPGV